jgi:hypothetical protein
MCLPALEILQDMSPDEKQAAALDTARLLLNQEWRLNNLYRIVNKDGEEIQFRI